MLKTSVVPFNHPFYKNSQRPVPYRRLLAVPYRYPFAEPYNAPAVKLFMFQKFKNISIRFLESLEEKRILHIFKI